MVAVSLIAAAVRWYRIGAQALWLDEAHTFSRSTLAPSDLIRDSIENLHTPPYFLGMHYWLQLGDSEAMLRAPSAFFGVLTVIATYVAGAIVGGRFVGFGAALLLAICPSHIHYGQEARMYTVLTFGAATTLAALLWIAKHPELAAQPWWRRSFPDQSSLRPVRVAWLSLAAATLVSLWTHSIGFIVVLAGGLGAVAILVHHSALRLPLLRNGVAAYSIAIIGWGWWVPILASQSPRFSQHSWGALTFDHLFREASAIFFFSQRNNLVQALIMLLIAIGLHSLRERPAMASVLGLFAVTGPLVLVGLSMNEPVIAHRLIVWATIPTVVLIARGLDTLPRAALRWPALIAGVIALAATAVPDYYRRSPKARWDKLAQLIIDQHSEDSVVFVAPSRTAVDPLFYYFHRAGIGDSIRVFAVRPETVANMARKKRWMWLIARDLETSERLTRRLDTIERYADLTWKKSFSRREHLYKYFVRRGASAQPSRKASK